MSTSLSRLPLLAAAMAVLSWATSASAVTTLTVDLTNGSVAGNSLMVDVVGRYDDGGDMSADLVEFQLDVRNSSANLSAGGTDYSRFSFDLSSNAPFDIWTPVNGFADPFADVSRAQYDNDFGFAAALDDTGGMFVEFGTLTVDLTGLPGGQASTVSIGFLDPFDGTWAAYDDGLGLFNIDDVNVFANGNAGQFTFTTPGGTGGGFSIPEPATVTAFFGLALVAMRRRRLNVTRHLTC